MRISDWSSDVCSSDLAVIIEYLNEAFHGPPDLMPINAVIRAQARAWCRRLDSTDALRVITFQQRALPAFAALAPDQFEKIAAAHPTRSSRSEEHTSELTSLMRISYAVFCLKNKKQK